MTSQRWSRWIAAAVLGLAAAGHRDALGQFGGGTGGGGYPSIGQFGGGVSYGGLGGLGGVGGGPSFGYGIRTGQVGGGYQSSYGLYRGAYAAPARTTVALQPLYSAITSLPGWDGPTRRVHRRARYDNEVIPHYDHNGKILWPGLVRDDPSSAELRSAAESAFQGVYRESKSTGHASIRPVIAAKEKLSAYERRILPGIKGRSVADGDYLERFFVDLDRSLDQMNAVY